MYTDSGFGEVGPYMYDGIWTVNRSARVDQRFRAGESRSRSPQETPAA
jgi:hypothetical protein